MIAMLGLNLNSLILALVLQWIVCGIFTYGYTYAYFQGEYADMAERNRKADRKFAFMCSLMGTIGLLLILFLFDGAKHGLKFRK